MQLATLHGVLSVKVCVKVSSSIVKGKDSAELSSPTEKLEMKSVSQATSFSDQEII